MKIMIFLSFLVILISMAINGIYHGVIFEAPSHGIIF